MTPEVSNLASMAADWAAGRNTTEMEISPENSPKKNKKVVDYGAQRKVNDILVNHVTAVVPNPALNKAKDVAQKLSQKISEPTGPAPVPKPTSSKSLNKAKGVAATLTQKIQAPIRLSLAGKGKIKGELSFYCIFY